MLLPGKIKSVYLTGILGIGVSVNEKAARNHRTKQNYDMSREYTIKKEC